MNIGDTERSQAEQNFQKQSIILNICLSSLIQSLKEIEKMPKQEKGQSHQTRPVSKRPPNWCKYQPEEVEALIVKLAREGNSPSHIGTILRDNHSIPLVKPIVGKTITKILRDADLAPAIPEDLGALLRKAESLSIHYEKNKRDLHNKRALQILEAKIHKLSRYYKREGALPQNWKYEPKIASVA
jgi:small subunit ribosomal protein S15